MLQWQLLIAHCRNTCLLAAAYSGCETSQCASPYRRLGWLRAIKHRHGTNAQKILMVSTRNKAVLHLWTDYVPHQQDVNQHQPKNPVRRLIVSAASKLASLHSYPRCNCNFKFSADKADTNYLVIFQRLEKLVVFFFIIIFSFWEEREKTTWLSHLWNDWVRYSHTLSNNLKLRAGSSELWQQPSDQKGLLSRWLEIPTKPTVERQQCSITYRIRIGKIWRILIL